MNPWMIEALVEARKAEAMGEVPVGAIIVLGDDIVGRGHNLKESMKSPIAHAEIQAIIDATKALNSWRLEKCKMYVTLEPCPMCAGALQQARIESVIYGATDAKAGVVTLGLNLNKNSDLNHRFEMKFEPSLECSTILTNFFRRLRKPGL